MPAPYSYEIHQPDVGSYFQAFRQGRADRMAGEEDARRTELSKYLPQALEGDAGARTSALGAAAGNPDQMIALKNAFSQMDATKLQQIKDQQAKVASLAVWADTPEKWAVAVKQAEADGVQGAAQIPFEQRGAVIAKAQTVADQLEQVWKEKSFELDASRTKAQNAASYASADAARASAEASRRKPMGGIDPNTGVRQAPAGLQGRDSGELAKARASSDAAANIAATLMSAAPALSQVKTGAGTGLARNIAGVFSATGFFPSADEFTKNYDAIEQASKTIGIDTLQKVGGSDTERELLTAIQTTVNPDVQPQENIRRFRDQIASADILAKKAQFMTEWVNKAGSLSYALPNGMTWPQFWSEYQKAAWSDHRKAQQQPTRGGDYRGEQRRLLQGQGQPSGVKPPPGFEVVQ